MALPLKPIHQVQNQIRASTAQLVHEKFVDAEQHKRASRYKRADAINVDSVYSAQILTLPSAQQVRRLLTVIRSCRIVRAWPASWLLQIILLSLNCQWRKHPGYIVFWMRLWEEFSRPAAHKVKDAIMHSPGHLSCHGKLALSLMQGHEKDIRSI